MASSNTRSAVPSVEEIRRRVNPAVRANTEAIARRVETMENSMESEITRRVDAAVTRVVEKNLGRKLSAAEMRARLDVLLEKYDFNPIEELIRTAQDPDTPLAERTKINLQLTEYLLPKLKSVEVQGTVDHNHTIVIERYGEDGTVSRERVHGHAAPVKTIGEETVNKVVVDV